MSSDVEALKKLAASEQGRKFDLVCSNPPYQAETSQKETDGQKTVTNVFQYFQEVADTIAIKSSMIYPGERWVQQSGKGMKEFGHEQVNSRFLQAVIYYPDRMNVFGEGVGIQGGVTIVFKDFDQDNDGKWLLIHGRDLALKAKVKSPGDEIVSLDPNMNQLLTKVKAHLGRTLGRASFEQKLFALESSFIEDNIDAVTLCNKNFTNKPSEDSIRILTNDKAGKAGRVQWYWVDKQLVPARHDLFGKWKIIISSVNTTGVNNRSPRLEILPPNTAFGRSRLGIGFFDTEDEAKNFYKWWGTDFVRTLLASSGDLLTSFAVNVPDPEDFRTNGNSGLDFTEAERSLNDQLCDRYGLDADDKVYMKEFVETLAPLVAIEQTIETAPALEWRQSRKITPP